MAGNEQEVTKYLIQNIGEISLPHLGLITCIESPTSSGLIPLTTISQIDSVVTQDANKKADIFINHYGISVKQEGGSFSFNRLQRSELIKLFSFLKFSDPINTLALIDEEVQKYHDNELSTRSRPWNEMFTSTEFFLLLDFLMTKGSPNKGLSTYPAEFIMEAPKLHISSNTIKVFTMKEYFDFYSSQLKIGVRRQWIGQISNSEHNRAISISRKRDNSKWVYKDFTGEPNPSITGAMWRNDVPASDRREVYMLFIEKK